MHDFRNNPWPEPGAPGPASPAGAQGTPTHPSNEPPQADPVAPQPQRQSVRPSSSPRRHRSHHGHGSSSSSRRKIRVLKLVVGLLLVLLVLGGIGGAVLWNRYITHRSEAIALSAKIQQLEEELTEARDKLTRMNNDMRIMLANRLPGVTMIQLNRQIEINDRYFRSITLSRAGVGNDGALSFHAVLQNQRPTAVLPQARILLFDDQGLQTGATELAPQQSITPVATPELQPQETRTYSGNFEMGRDVPSRYFVVEVR